MGQGAVDPDSQHLVLHILHGVLVGNEGIVGSRHHIARALKQGGICPGHFGIAAQTDHIQGEVHLDDGRIEVAHRHQNGVITAHHALHIQGDLIGIFRDLFDELFRLVQIGKQGTVDAVFRFILQQVADVLHQLQVGI